MIVAGLMVRNKIRLIGSLRFGPVALDGAAGPSYLGGGWGTRDKLRCGWGVDISATPFGPRSIALGKGELFLLKMRKMMQGEACPTSIRGPIGADGAAVLHSKLLVACML